MARAEEGPPTDSDLQAVLARVEAGQSPDREQLRAKYPNYPNEVDELCRVAEQYASLLDCLPPADLVERGRTLGDFVIEGPHAVGGTAVVYRARQRSLGDRLVALKVLPISGLSEREIERFRREALVAAHIHHPNVAEVYGFGENDGLLYYAMRLVEGPTLQDVLIALTAGGIMGRGERHILIERAAEIAAALATLHSKNLVHRDVKPSNIVLEGGKEDAVASLAGRAVLVDFGLLRSIRRDHTGTRTTAATRAYASPEQALGKSLDARSDIFSFGATLHDLLTSRLPENRSPASAGLELVDQLEPAVDADLVALVAKACDFDARWRYPDGSALEADLRRWLIGAPVSARHLGAIERASRWARSHPEKLLRVLTLSFAALLAGLLFIPLVAIQLRHVSRASNARNSGDVRTLADALGNTHPVIVRTLLSDDMRGIRRALRNPKSVDPVAKVDSLLRSGAQRDALFEAAAYVASDGLDAHPLLSRFLLRAIDPAVDVWPADRTDAVHAATLLFLDRPSRSVEDVRESTPFRARFLDLLTGPPPDFSPEDQLYFLMGLSGCGTLADVPPVLDWLESLPEETRLTTEQSRMAAACSARIVRHANQREERELPFDPSAQLERGGRWVRDLSGRENTQDEMAGWAELAKALVFFERRAGRALRAPTWSELLPRHERIRILAAAEDPSVSALLNSANDLEPDILGWCSAVLEDLPWAASRLADSDRRAFEAAATEAREEARGAKPSQKPSRTLHIGPPGELRAISTGRVAEELDRVLARWDFGRDPVGLSGGADAVRASPQLTFHVDRGSNYWSSPATVHALMELDFVLDEQDAHVAIELQLRHLAASRPFVPRGGAVYLDISLDGTAIRQELVDWHGAWTSHQHIEESRLGPGWHTITLRTSPATTTWRLEDIRLVPATK